MALVFLRGMGMIPKLSGGVRKFFLTANITRTNMSLIKYALLISVPDLADVGDPLGGKGCLLPPKILARGSRSKKCHTL